MSYLLVVFLLLPGIAFAEPSELQKGVDTIWLVLAGALVFFMQAGFALLESGMARAKNAVNVVMKNYIDVCIGSVAFWAVGYGLMFGGNDSGWFGTDHFMISDVSHLDYSLLFFQTMFAATAITIASGAMAERTRYHAYLIGAVIVSAVIYPVFGSWVWGSLYDGKGWLNELGFIDFAGSTVVHSVGGWVALAGIIVLGPRLGKYTPEGKPRRINGHNLTLVGLGGMILWLGWFGFNGGSTAAADTSIGLIVLNTHLAASSGAIGSIAAMLLSRQKILLTNSINGSIAGLVGITAGCASMEPQFAVITGLIAGVLIIPGEKLLEIFHLDDVVGAVSVHGFAGVWGTIAAGMFLKDNLFDPHVIFIQIVGVVAAFLWAFPTSLIMYMLIDKVVGLRASTQDEQQGLDYSEHYEIGYPEFNNKLLHKGK